MSRASVCFRVLIGLLSAVLLLAAQSTETVLRERLKQNPNDVEANLNLGLLLAGRGDMANAEKH